MQRLLCYYVDTVGRKKAIEEYIKNQLMEGKIEDQINMKEYMDPFTGEPVSDCKKKNKFYDYYKNKQNKKY